MSDFQLVTVNESNVDKLGFFCVQNKKHPGYISKRRWLRDRFSEGLRIKLIRTAEEKTAGFLEYIPGEYTWRVVKAQGFFVIHCLWVASKKFPLKGMAAALLGDCYRDAESQGKKGVAVVTSDGPWMANKRVYQKYGFREVDHAPPAFQLLTQEITDGAAANFPVNWEQRLQEIQALTLLYTDQCPYISKAVGELPAVAKAFGVELKLEALGSAAVARQRMPTAYGTICLAYQGRVLADHPISTTRFKNILKKDLGLREKK